MLSNAIDREDAVQFRIYSPAEMDELKRERDASFEELGEFIAMVGDHCSAELRRVKHIESTRSREELEMAATRAAVHMIRALIKTWHLRGTVRPWDAYPQPYRTAVRHALTDIRREQKRLRTREWLTDEALPPRRFQPPEPFDDAGLETVDYYKPIPASLARLSPPLLAAVAARTLRVLAERNKRPKLDENQAIVARFLQEMELSIVAMTPDDIKRAESFEVVSDWRQELAASLGITIKRIYEITPLILAYVRIGYYLFIVLAPADEPVVDSASMNRLLDFVYLRGPDIDTTSRQLLQKAGSALTHERGTWQVDISAFIREVRADLRKVVCSSDVDILFTLHSAEEVYARQVPMHTDPLMYQCVVRCKTHTLDGGSQDGFL